MTNRLETELVGDDRLRITRRFAAPPEEVFRAHFEPVLVRQWMLGPPGWSMPVCDIEAVVGAAIHIRWEKSPGESFGMRGKVLELERPSRSVHTELFEFPGATESVVETRFVADGTGTRLELLITYASRAARDGAIDSGMTDGMEASYARIDQLVG